MYKDKDKQREAGRERARRYRENRQKALLSEGVTDKALPIGLHGASVLGIDPTELADSVFNVIPKRGKDIKCFEDLPPDVQATINRQSTFDGEINETIKVGRTAIAIHYQHLFPDRFHSTGIAI